MAHVFLEQVFDEEAYINSVVDWIVCSNEPFLEVENPWFRRMMQAVNPDVPDLGDDRIRNRIKKELERCFELVKEELQVRAFRR